MYGGPGEGAQKLVSTRSILGLSLLGFVAIRLLPAPSVFRGGDIVFLGNDPYAYSHVIQQVVTGAVPIGSQSGYGLGEPLLIACVAIVSRLFGGGFLTDLFLAVYPVIAGVVIALLTYVLGKELTADPRIAITGVIFLAITPINVSRTALGFADHHAFDLLWVTAVAALLVWLVANPTASMRQRYLAGGGLGVAVASQTLAWEASPMLLLPAAIALGLASFQLVDRDRPTRELGPVVFGLGIGAGLVVLAHLTLGWGSTIVAATPVLLFLGGAVLLSLLGVTGRFERSRPTLLVLEIGAVLVGGVGLLVVLPELTGDISGNVEAVVAYFARHTTTGIGETHPLAGTFGPVRGFMILLGFAPFFALPAVPWAFALGWVRRNPAWLVPAVYLGWFLGLSLVQRRFAVHLTPFLAVFGGVGFVAFTEWLGVLQAPSLRSNTEDPAPVDNLQAPERERLAILGGMALVGTGFSAVISSEILSRLRIDGPSYRAAAWIREYASSLGLAYPENYVLAEWGRVRMYNHFVNGHSRGYGYARQRYGEFLTSSHPDDWYEEFAGRVGFVVTREYGDVSPMISLGLLHDEYGSRSGAVPGTGHFRALWESSDGSVRVFSVVEGARIEGTAPSGTVLDVVTTVELAPDAAEIRYERRVEVGAEGKFSLTVAHPGTYSLGDTQVTVSESAVRSGGVISVDLGPSP